MQNIMRKNAPHDVAMRQEVLASVSPVVSIRVDRWDADDQHHTGRCWLHAAMNVFRSAWMTRAASRTLRLSTNYLAFYDKLERAALCLRRASATAHLPWHDRLVQHYFVCNPPIEDGGQWNMVELLIRKLIACEKLIASL